MFYGNEKQMLKKLYDYCAGFYYDCTRNGLASSLVTIGKDFEIHEDLSRFVEDLASKLFYKIYMEDERLSPQFVTGMIDIVMEFINVETPKSKFTPASAMAGDNDKQLDIRSLVIEKFNSLLEDKEEEYAIKSDD